MQTLDKFVEKAVIDTWKNPEKSELSFDTPHPNGSSDGTWTFTAKWSYSGSYQDEFRAPAGQLDKEDRHEAEDQKTRVTKEWTQMLEERGMTVIRQNGGYEATARQTFDEEQVAKILNSQRTVIAPVDVVAKERRRKHDTGGPDRKYVFNTQRVFELGKHLGLSDKQIYEGIKAKFSRQ